MLRTLTLFFFIQIQILFSSEFVVNTTSDLVDDPDGMSLREAISLAVNDDIITFNQSLNDEIIFVSSELSPSTGVTIDATGLSDGITLNGQDATEFIISSSGLPNLSGITFEGATNTLVITNGGTISHCRFNGGTNQSNGVASTGTQLQNITHCDFESCEVALAIMIHTAVVSDSRFTQNTSAIRIISPSGDVEITRCFFEDNTSTSGSAINADGGDSIDPILLKISHSQFIDNVASGNGGAIFLNNSRGNGTDPSSPRSGWIIADCIFEGNNSAGNGGAVFKEPTNAFGPITRSQFSSNTATGDGGAIACFDSSGACSIRDSFFQSNEGLNGGAIFCLSHAIISGSSFIRNSSQTGGAIATNRFLLRSNFFQENSSTLNGGAISATDLVLAGTEIKITDTTFLNNTTQGIGGAIYIQNDLQPIFYTQTMRNTTFHGNVSSSGGAALHLAFNQNFFIYHCTFTANAGEAAIINDSLNKVGITSSVIANNTPVDIKTRPNSPVFFGVDSFINKVDRRFPNIEVLSTLDPMLAPIGLYGGSIPTRPPLPGSPLIDYSGTNSSTESSSDQRGLPRGGDGNLHDIGAVEFQGVREEALLGFESDLDEDGVPAGLELAIGTDPYVAELVHPQNLTFLGMNQAALPSFQFTHDDPTIELKIMRSTDLKAFDHEVYSSSESGSVMTEDGNPPENGSAFYRLEAIKPVE